MRLVNFASSFFQHPSKESCDQLTMSQRNKKPNGCGCANIPISLLIVLFGIGYWWVSRQENFDVRRYLSKLQQVATSKPTSSTTPPPAVTLPPASPTLGGSSSPSTVTTIPTPTLGESPQSPASRVVATPTPTTTPSKPLTPWQKKNIRGVYLSRYNITNNASEAMIRERVRYYHSQGFNTIIHGVWGNACTMYPSQVLQQTFGSESCPNKFQDQWLDWLIDEAHQQGMEVHAYFEKGIKIDQNSPIFELASSQNWLVPGIDKTHPGIDHYVLDVTVPEVANFFTDILVEFVKRYPEIDAVQWDDYLAYYAELPGNVDRTASLTQFVETMITAMKQANPRVSFDICHHNPYWAKRYFAADWQNWSVDRVFIQVYNEENFQAELNYVQQHDGIAITERQFHRLDDLVNNPKIDSILIFPLSGKPRETVAQVRSLTDNVGE